MSGLQLTDIIRPIGGDPTVEKFPVGMTCVQLYGPGANALGCDLDTLEDGATASLTLVVTYKTKGDKTNTAQLWASKDGAESITDGTLLSAVPRTVVVR